MLHSNRVPLLLLVPAASLWACGRGSPAAGARGASDSAATVQAAVSALKALPGHAGPYGVVTYRRDSAGVLVGLQRQGAVLRDGALVRVARSGAAAVQQVW